MAKKSFKGGLDNLLASAGIKKRSEQTENKLVEISSKKELSDDEKHWMLIKIENLNKELALWRTGKLTVSEFQESLKKHGLSYNSGINEIVEK
ncbi:MAG: hypothetical protein L3J35_05605 [Bacteroidales bacterium]|nr:hypothetical protein [Bacteroidales bacterium]